MAVARLLEADGVDALLLAAPLQDARHPRRAETLPAGLVGQCERDGVYCAPDEMAAGGYGWKGWWDAFCGGGEGEGGGGGLRVGGGGGG